MIQQPRPWRVVALSLAFTLLIAGGWLCGCMSGQPQQVLGPSVVGDEPPTIEIISPNASISINQGERFDITWQDRDPDSAAMISLYLQQVDTGFEILLVSNIAENDSVAPDSFNVATDLVPFGSYYIRAQITDDTNPAVSVFAQVEGTTSTRVVVNVGEPGTNPLNVPPRIAVVQPAFNQGVAQDDTLLVSVQPTRADPDENFPYDADESTTLFILLDLDDDPENDDPQLPDPTGIIILREVTIAAGTFEAQNYTIPIDLAQIPARADGEPYYIRATIIDQSNPPVHAYAAGTIHIVRSAVSPVDLSLVGTELAGARFQGFNPGSRLGTTMTNVSDFDADGVEDFVLVAQFGNPRNFGNIGEAYLLYGQSGARFGGIINVNSVSTTIPGVIFEGPPNRLSPLHEEDVLFTPRGITSASYIPDLSGDGRPELLMGMALVDGMFQGRDDDPSDDPASQPVRIVVRADLRERTINGVPDPTLEDDDYQGVVDAYLDRLSPNSSFLNSQQLLLTSGNDVENDGGNQYPIIEWDISSILTLFTILSTDDIDDLEVTMILTANPDFDAQGADLFSVHQLFRSVANNTEYVDYNQDGVPGPTEESDYDQEEIESSMNFNPSNNQVQLRIDLTEQMEDILDGQGGRLAYIIVPIENNVDEFFYSSEASLGVRPRIEITYKESLDEFPNIGCYPDPWTNNMANRIDDPANLPLADSTLESQGSVFFITSENRDLYPPVQDAERLESTIVTLELVGQQDTQDLLGPETPDGIVTPDPQINGTIRHQAGDPEEGTLRGIRFGGGWWEYVNGGNFGAADPRVDHFGQHVSWMPDVTNDFQPEMIISAPRNELYLTSLTLQSIADQSIYASTVYQGSIAVVAGFDYSRSSFFDDDEGNYTVPGRPVPDQGDCEENPTARWRPYLPAGGFEIFAEEVTDYLGGAEYAGDVNLDGVPDIVCGAPLNDHPKGLVNSGAAYIIYGRTPVGDVSLQNLDNPNLRPPSLRIRGETAGDQIGWRQISALDINGDRVDDVVISSPKLDPLASEFLASTPACSAGVDLNVNTFNACRNIYEDEVFSDDPCKQYDFDNDRDIDADDRVTFDCLVSGFDDCCPVDNGFVGVIFGNVDLDGDRDYTKIATSDLPGIKFYGANPLDQAGTDIASAGDFNRDGFGDLLITAPGVTVTDSQGRERLGVAYLIFGGTHLNGNLTFSLGQVGTDELPGIIFWSPFLKDRPNEAPIDHVGRLGDINDDGFDDIGLGITRADFIDSALPQDPNDPGTNPNIGRRPDDGNVFIIYGNNTGTNR